MTKEAQAQKHQSTYKYHGITKPQTITAESECPICADVASKRRLRNHCTFEIHEVYK